MFVPFPFYTLILLLVSVRAQITQNAPASGQPTDITSSTTESPAAAALIPPTVTLEPGDNVVLGGAENEHLSDSSAAHLASNTPVLSPSGSNRDDQQLIPFTTSNSLPQSTCTFTEVLAFVEVDTASYTTSYTTGPAGTTCDSITTVTIHTTISSDV